MIDKENMPQKPENENIEKAQEKRDKNGLKLNNLFSHTAFSVIFSIVASFTMWFVLAANNDLTRSRIVYDVPIEVTLSDFAKEEGVRIFAQQYETADVSIEGNNLVINSVSNQDISVIAEFQPSSTKLSANEVKTEILTLSAVKVGNSLSEYSVTDIFPDEIEVIFDRYKEETFTIENQITYVASENHYVNSPTFSQSSVTLAGPEAMIDKVSSVAVVHEIGGLVTETQNFTSNLVLLDENDEILELDGSFIELSITEVDVSLEVLNKKTVDLEISTLNMPEGFSSTRIVVDPLYIDIAGPKDALAEISVISLPRAIDFRELTPINNVFEIEIPLPSGVRNVSNVNTATVTVNLNGFDQTTIDSQNIQFTNVQEGKEVTLVTKSISVDIVGSTAQINRLTDESIYGTIDMSNYKDQDGTLEVPVTFNVSNATSCWVTGQYTAYVTISDKPVEPVLANNSESSDNA